MHPVITLLLPRTLSVRTGFRQTVRNGRFNPLIVLGFIGLLFWGGIFAVSLRVLTYFKSIETLGDILAFKLLSMVLVTLFSLLVFSSLLTTLSKLYLSRDLALVHSLPVPAYRIYSARLVEIVLDSSWMVAMYTLPVFISYGIVFRAGWPFYAGILLVLPLLGLLASSLSAILIMLAALILSAGRLRSLFIFFGLLLFLVLFLAFRLLRPERLVDPEMFGTALQYLAALKTPDSPFYPTTWAFDGLAAALQGRTAGAAFHIGLLISATSFLTILSIGISQPLYFRGISRADGGYRRQGRKKTAGVRRLPLFSRPAAAFAVKEIKSFLRDQTQWSQLLLIAGLVAVYTYNFSVLPLNRAPIRTVYLQNLLAFLNMGLAAFVLTAITARFAFPAVSQEKDAIWLVHAAPLTKKQFLWIKFLIYFPPLLLLTETLIVATNLLLGVTPFLMWLSVGTIACLTPGITALGIGLGAAFPDFKAENPVQTVTGYGGFLFMLLSGLYVTAVLLLEAGPVYRIFMAGLSGRSLSLPDGIWLIVTAGTIASLGVATLLLPMRYGITRMSAS